VVPGPDLWSSATGLAAALGRGLLIGLERERRKRGVEWGPTRPPAGIRSFALAALGGGIAQTLQQPWLVALGAALVAVLVAVAYGASRRPPPPGAPPPDPGLTTELALFVTYLVGVLAVQQPALGAGAAAVAAGLLAARERLHRFATRALSDAEWHDALVLAALVLVLLPLAPTTPLPWLAGLAPRTLLSLMTLILVLQAAGHVALRLLGPNAGMAGSGALSGFVSSTATIASMGARARAEPALAQACTAGAVFSTAATWVQAMLLLVATAPAAAAHWHPARRRACWWPPPTVHGCCAVPAAWHRGLVRVRIRIRMRVRVRVPVLVRMRMRVRVQMRMGVRVRMRVRMRMRVRVRPRAHCGCAKPCSSPPRWPQWPPA